MSPPTEWAPILGPGEKYRTDRMHEAKTEDMSAANGWPTTDAMSDDSTSWTEITGP